MLDALRHTRGYGFGIAPAQSTVHLGAQESRRRLALGNRFVGIFVAQFVEREMAASGDHLRFGEQFGRVDPCQSQARAQVAFAVGKERLAGSEQRRIQTDRGQRILQWAAGAQVHVHVAGGHCPQAARSGEILQHHQSRGVIGPGMQSVSYTHLWMLGAVLAVAVANFAKQFF